MANRLIIFVVIVTVVQGSFALLSGESVEASSDVQLAKNNSTEAWNQAMDVIFATIEGNLTIEDGRDQYFANVVRGCDYYLAVAPSLPQSDALHDTFANLLRSFVDTLFEAVRLAAFNNGTHLETLNKINAIQRATQIEPVLRSFFAVSGSASILIQTKTIVDLGRLYSHIFSGILSRTASNFGIGDGDQSAFKDRAIAAVKDVSDDVYASLQTKTGNAGLANTLSTNNVFRHIG